MARANDSGKTVGPTLGSASGLEQTLTGSGEPTVRHHCECHVGPSPTKIRRNVSARVMLSAAKHLLFSPWEADSSSLLSSE